MFKKKQCLTFVSVIMAMTVILFMDPTIGHAEMKKEFKDVNEKTVPDESMRQAIDRLVELTGIDGYNDGTFRPYENVKRIQAAKMTTGAFGLSLQEDLERVLNKYNDVDLNYRDTPFIAAVTVTDFFKGNEKGQFQPWSNMTRSQMAIVLGRILKDYDTEDDVDVNLENLDKETAKAVQVLANLGVTTETENFRPYENVTRLQAALFLYRAEEVIDKNA